MLKLFDLVLKLLDLFNILTNDVLTSFNQFVAEQGGELLAYLCLVFVAFKFTDKFLLLLILLYVLLHSFL